MPLLCRAHCTPTRSCRIALHDASVVFLTTETNRRKKTTKNWALRPEGNAAISFPENQTAVFWSSPEGADQKFVLINMARLGGQN
jgi:hypothetical protein